MLIKTIFRVNPLIRGSTALFLYRNNSLYILWGYLLRELWLYSYQRHRSVACDFTNIIISWVRGFVKRDYPKWQSIGDLSPTNVGALLKGEPYIIRLAPTALHSAFKRYSRHSGTTTNSSKIPSYPIN